MFDDLFSDVDTGAVWDAATTYGSEFNQPRGSETVTSNALQSMTPVDSSANGSNWGSFFQGAFNNVMGYAMQRDAARNNLGQQQPANQAALVALQAQQQRQQQAPGGLLMLVVVGAVIFVAAKAAK